MTASMSPVSMFPLPELMLWRDPITRSGEECMAVDEVLLEWQGPSIMRCYVWQVPTVTYGFFDCEEEARRIFDNSTLHYVRRWTGGGIVDHRFDIPFTLVLRKQDGAERPASSVLYRVIHGALAQVMHDCGVEGIMLSHDAPHGGRACFTSPVESDLVSPNGCKLAGGGQRRSKNGILHQGSIQNCCLPQGWDILLAKKLTRNVKISNNPEPFSGFQQKVHELTQCKYLTPEWQRGGHRRPVGG